MEIEPILDKPPPSAEGELLKQNSKSVLSMGQWRHCYFAVRSDKLLYFKNKEECEMNKEPIATFRMSQIEEIVEAVFNGVPKKHHVNCGFSIVIYQSSTGKRETFNLLAETPESMQLWVYNLRYIKAYWSRKHTRETVINEEQERKLLEKLLREEEDNKEAVVGTYSISDGEAELHSITLYFDSGTKCPVKVSLTDTVASVLEKVSDRLSSSGDLMWTVNAQGEESMLSPTDIPALLSLKGNRFFVLNPAKRVLVIFFNKKSESSFECIAVPTSITASDVLQHRDIAAKIDLQGIANAGLFLKSKEESLFDSNECPCDALFAVTDGKIDRLGTDYLLVKNKAIGGSQFTRPKRPTQRTTRYFHNKVEAEEEEEDAQAKALNRLYQKSAGGEHSDTTSTAVPRNRQWQRDATSPSPSQAQTTPPQISRSGNGSFKDTSSPSQPRTTVASTSSAESQNEDSSHSRFQRRGALKPGGSSRHRNGPKGEAITEANEDDPVAAPTQPSKPVATQPEKSPSSQLEKIPPPPQPEKSPLSQPQKNPLPTQPEKTPLVQSEKAVPTPAEKSTTIQQDKTMVAQSESTVVTPQAQQSERRRKVVTSYADSKQSVPAQVTTPPVLATPTNTLDPPPQAEPSKPPPQAEPSRPPPQAEPFRPLPMVINLDKLAALNKAPPTSGVPGDSTTSSSVVGRQLVPIDVRTPNMLKIVLLQASGPSSAVSEAGPMDLIALSGVCLRNERGTWRIVPGSNFHEPPPTTSTDHTETFPLTGGIRAVFNHTQKCWYVLPPLTVTTGEPQQETKGLTDSQKSDSVKRSNSHSQPTELFLSKKVLVTGVGGAIHSVLAQFEQTRNAEEKKRIGCDMTNPNMGHLVRGALCTALAGVLLDGLKPYRFQGLVTDDIWKVTSSFWQEAVSKGHLLPTIDKQVFQPIRLVDGSHDNNMKYRTFICSALNKGALSTWIETLPNQRDTLNRHYQPTSFLVLASENGGFQGLFSELLVTLEPLVHVPFSFSIDFELRQAEVARFQPPVAARSTSKEEPLQRSNVILKTNASTGQTTGNIVNAVWERPQEQTNSSEDSPIIQEDVDSSRSAAVDVSKTVADRPNVQGHYQKQKTVSNLFGSLSVTTSGWIKKMSTSLQQFDINAGGAMIPKSTPPSLKTSPSELAPPPPERIVEAIFSNTAEEHDELSFQKGDVLTLKEQINTEWYLCTKGDQTGIVPANYVRVLEKSP